MPVFFELVLLISGLLTEIFILTPTISLNQGKWRVLSGERGSKEYFHSPSFPLSTGERARVRGSEYGNNQPVGA